MLVTRRKSGESILIGSNIEVRVLEIGAGFVKLGISGPREIRVERKELRVTSEQNLIASHPLQAGDLSQFLDHVLKAVKKL